MNAGAGDETPMQLAKKIGNQEVIALLAAKGAK